MGPRNCFGGDSVVYQGSSNEGREYTVMTTIDMEEGYYDIRTRQLTAVDKHPIGQLYPALTLLN